MLADFLRFGKKGSAETVSISFHFLVLSFILALGMVSPAIGETALSHAYLLSIPTGNGEPTRIAVDDASGLIYV
ncbi:MAG: hypothetical protein K8I82_00720, partial [Anaerolineae bacterium]|nr:hypothetical protein [Anaerolineae bacterium]